MRLERKKGVKGIKIHHNKTLFWVIIFLAAVLIGLMIFGRITENKKAAENKNNDTNTCVTNDDCIMQKIGCCPCSMGGKEVCMLVKNSSLTNEKLSRECGARTVCTAMYACQETSCGCVNGKCIEK